MGGAILLISRLYIRSRPIFTLLERLVYWFHDWNRRLEPTSGSQDNPSPRLSSGAGAGAGAGNRGIKRDGLVLAGSLAGAEALLALAVAEEGEVALGALVREVAILAALEAGDFVQGLEAVGAAVALGG